MLALSWTQLITRLVVSEHFKLKIWLEGPKFLSEDESQWPIQPTQLHEIGEDNRNVNRSKKAQAHVITQGREFDSLFITTFRLKNYFLHRIGKIAKEELKRGELSVQEI